MQKDELEEISRWFGREMADYLEAFAAAYLKLTDIPADEAVLVQQQTAGGIRVWFERKTTLDKVVA